MRILSMYTMNDLRCVFIGTDESDDYIRMAVTDTVRPPYDRPRTTVHAMPSAARRANDAAAAAGAIPRPRGAAPRDFPSWDSLRGVWTSEPGGDGERRPRQTLQSEYKDRTAGEASARDSSGGCWHATSG